MLVNKKNLARVFGVSLPTVDVWVTENCPVHKRGGFGVSWEFDLADVIAWRDERERQRLLGNLPKDEHELKLRKLAAETALAELGLEKERQTVIALPVLERELTRALSEVRTGMLNIPSRVVSQLIGETNELRFKTVLMDEIRQTLAALSSLNFATPEGEGDAASESDA